MSEDGARRFWTYGKGQWSGPLVSRGGDEYGNSTVVFRLPSERALIVAYNWPLRRELEPCEGRVEWGAVNDDHGAPMDNPLPLAGPDLRGLPPEEWKLVRRELWASPWQEVPE